MGLFNPFCYIPQDLLLTKLRARGPSENALTYIHLSLKHVKH